MKITTSLLKLRLSFAIILVVVTTSLTAQDLTIPQKNYTAKVDFSNAPKRINDNFPLSDQENKRKWKLQKEFTDEFDGKKLNPIRWYENNPFWKGRKPTFFHASNVSLDDGQLVIKLNQHGDEKLPEGYTHTTGFIKTKKPILYGYVEAKLKPINASWMTGFWMTNVQPTWWTEIDICENAPGLPYNRFDLNSNIHVFRSPKKQGNVKEHFARNKKYQLPFELQKEYHVWGLEWNKKVIRFYIDGVLFREAKNTHWHQPLHINFNCESNKWFGAVPNDEGINEEYRVEYLRVWKRK